MQVLDRLLDHLELVDQEVGGVAPVGLGLHEGAGVLRRRFADESRDRQVLGEPVAAGSASARRRGSAPCGRCRPRTDGRRRARSAAGSPARPDGRTGSPSSPSLANSQSSSHPLRQLLGGRRLVDRRVRRPGRRPPPGLRPGCCRRPAAAGSSRVPSVTIRCSSRTASGVSVVAHLLAHELERPVVVGDHPLAAVLRLAPAAQHLLGHLPRSRRSLQLAGPDRLLHQRVDQEALTRLPLGGHDLVHRHLAAAALIDVVEVPEDQVGKRVAEGVPAGSVSGSGRVSPPVRP